MAGNTAKEGARVPRQPPRWFAVLHVVLFVATVVAVAWTRTMPTGVWRRWL